ncbi:di-trans,poly-cis-decaprenylcistransferase [Paracoccus sp. M683]|uniref:glycoside hydrolase family 88/105 protein n=1 Tax=Paracoccus sp. M683 TaxID=2594268 RepID=UPI001180B088|nr:glycoside hydrolase family 88 protein [Paracoccus sp. M683]TRW94189.1 di-trans,poly-cis-decaprenylcistransferase [Paracoccus sp. M683]
MLNDYIDDYVTRYQPYKGGAWCYEDGCIYRGLELLHRETGEARWLDHLHRLADAQIGADGSLSGYNLSDYNIDNVLPGRALLYLHELTGEARYRTAADLLARQLATHPRTRSGVYWHKLRYPWQIWLDGIYMGQPFRIAHAQLTGQHEAVQDSLRQIDTALQVLLDPANGLYRHAYDEAREQPWADKTTGQSPAFWARAIGWLAMALVDVADLVGDDFAPLRGRTEDLLDRIQALRQPGGLWLQVIDRPDLAGNYQETSTSAMFTYALLRGARLGLSAPPKELAQTLMSQVVQPKAGGGFEMVEICEVAGLGMFEGRFRDGSAEYYLTERRVADDAKGVGPLMMAAALAGRDAA